MTRKTPADFALWAALPMAHTSKVEGRITMVLDTTRRRTSPRRFLLLAAVTGAAALVPLSMLRPAAQAAPVSAAPQTAKQNSSSGAPPFNWALETQLAGENAKFMRGQQFSPQEAAIQEKRLAVNPNDYAAHLCLLGYYLHSEIYSKPLSIAAARLAYRQQMFWLIQNHPESPLFSRSNVWVPRFRTPAAFEGDESLWQEQIAKHPGSTIILGNAAGYYTLSDKALVEKYLIQAQALEPHNPQWPGKLGELYRMYGRHPTAEAVQQSAKKALIKLELAASLANKTAQPNTSPELARTAFDAGEYDKARHYADALLARGESKPPTGFEPSDDVHEANLVLGRMALRDGDQAGAEAHLLAMGRVSGSPVLDSFGPNMQLAKDLLERGDRAPVLAYFGECAKFWTYQPGKATLATWIAEVKQGRIPDFRGNLDY